MNNEHSCRAVHCPGIFGSFLFGKPKETEVAPMTPRNGPVEAAGEAPEALQL